MKGTDLKRLRQVLLSAFPKRAKLAELVSFHLDQSLDEIVAESFDQSTAMFELLMWAKAQGKLDVLIRGALVERPESQELRALAEQMGLGGTAPSPSPTPVPPANTAPAPNKKSSLRLVWLASNSDAALATQLDKPLRILEKQGLFQVWSPREVLPGDEVRATVTGRIAVADIILLLTSADFLASTTNMDYASLALAQAKTRSVRVIPILLRPALLPPEIEKLGVLPPTRKPITTASNRDEAVLEVVNELKGMAEKLLAASGGHGA